MFKEFFQPKKEAEPQRELNPETVAILQQTREKTIADGELTQRESFINGSEKEDERLASFHCETGRRMIEIGRRLVTKIGNNPDQYLN